MRDERLKINTPFCNGPTNYETTLQLGGTGGNKNKEDNKIKRSVIFSRTGLLLEHNHSHRDRINCSFMNTNVHIALNV